MIAVLWYLNDEVFNAKLYRYRYRLLQYIEEHYYNFGCILKFHNFLISCNAVFNFIPSLPFKQQTNKDMWMYVG